MWLNIVLLIFVINTVVVIVMENRQPSNTWVWILLLLIVPVFGLVLYYLIGTRASRRQFISPEDLDTLKAHTASLVIPDSKIPLADNELISLLRRTNKAYPIGGNDITLYTSFADLLSPLEEDIRKARQHIHFQFFKFEDDEVGRRISDLLIAKAQQGVEVRVIIDAAANWSVSPRFFRRLRENGVQVVAFNSIFPYLSSFSNYRNHRKVVVIDGNIGYMGGMNIAARYLHGIRIGIWRDTHFRITGPAVGEMQIAFLSDWHFSCGELLNGTQYFPIQEKDATHSSGSVIQIVTVNPTDPWRIMNQAFSLLVLHTQKYVYLQSPYFIPTNPILNALCSAALAGKDVRLMIPAKSDKGILVPKATFSYLDRVLSAGVRVFLYDAGYMHAKTIVADDTICSIGSVNIDPRSLKLSFEINAFIYDPAIAVQQRDIFEQDMQQCHEIYLVEWRKRSFWKRNIESFARLFAPMF